MKIELKNRFSRAVLFSHECENNSIAITLVAAINAKANLRYVDLYGADLRYADLRDVDLRDADLYGADLRYADLRDVDLRDADLRYVDLRYVDLYGADLRYADLRYANLRYVDLCGANLRYVDLYGADLRYADLRDADLYGADLRYVDLYDADLYGAAKLTGDRPYFTIGPIGSRQDVLVAFLTGNGVFIRTGCFFGTVEEFRDKLQEEHGDNVHATEYRAALVLVEAHYNAWPATS